MPERAITPKKKDSLFDELERAHQEIRRRAYELFQRHRTRPADPVDDWLQAEREVFWRPAVEVRRKDGKVEVRAAIAGVDPEDLDVQVSGEDVVIRADRPHRHDEKSGEVHVCEFAPGRLFRSIRLPERIDPDSVEAEYRHGLLCLTASIAPRDAGRIDVPVH